MKKLHTLPLGLYEKALPYSDNWHDILHEAKRLEFSFVELSIDESAERMARLRWKASHAQDFLEAKLQTNMRVPSMCLSCHRSHPFGSASAQTRRNAFDIMRRAIDLADVLGIRVIQLAGYDVYYERQHKKLFDYFLEGMRKSAVYAAGAQVMLGMEIMDTEFLNSVSKYLSLQRRINSPWFMVYPDVGNVSAWNDTRSCHELISGLDRTVAIHLKDTFAVTKKSTGQFRDVPFGKGCVDFPAVFRALTQANYSGPFVVEMWARKDLATARRDVAKAREWLINLMRRAIIKTV